MSEQEKASALVAELRNHGQIPALDANVAAICNMAGDPLACTAELTSVILRDTSLTANIISTANSVLYGSAEPIKTVSSAILLMGFERVRLLATGLGILKHLGECAHDRNLNRLVACSYFSGLFAMALGRKLGQENSEELLVAGVLSQLPRLLLAHVYPDRYAAMEQQLITGKLTLDQACKEVFGVSYHGLAGEIARFWNLPDGIVQAVQDKPRGGPLGAALKQASRMAELLFGQTAGGAAALSSVERELRTTLKDPGFKLPQFIGDTCEADLNGARFFHLDRLAVDRMIKAVEGNRPSSGAENEQVRPAATPSVSQSDPDPSVLIGQYLTELMVSIRKGTDLNRILLTGLEAIHRSVRPSCTLLAFRDASKHGLQGRFHLAVSPAVRATDFHGDLRDTSSPIARCLSSQNPVQFSAKRDMPDSWFTRMGLDSVYVAPLVVLDNPVGICLVCRDHSALFAEQEQAWIEAVAGHIVTAFERCRPKG